MKLLILNTQQPPVERFWGDKEVVETVQDALQEGGLEVSVDTANTTEGVTSLIKANRPDIVFPNGYWLIGDGEKPYIVDVLDSLQIPYVGSSASALKIVSKQETKKRLIESGLPTPNYFIAHPPNSNGLPDTLQFPLIVKLDEGAESMGMQKVEDKAQLETAVQNLMDSYGQPITVEEYCREREYTIAMVGNKGSRNVMPIEIKLPAGFDFLNSEVKEHHIADTVRDVQSPEKRQALNELVNGVCDTFGIQDWTRIEILEDGKGKLYVIDVNNLPGLREGRGHPSYFPICTNRNLGLNGVQTINAIVYEAMQRTGLKAPEKMKNLLKNYTKKQ